MEWIKREAPGYAVGFGLGVLLAVSGAFGTDQLPIAGRLAYWLTLMFIGCTIGWYVSQRLIAIERWARSAWMAWLVITVVVAVAMAFVVWGLGLMMQWSSANPMNYLAILLPSFVISGLMSGIGVFLNQVPEETHAKASRFREAAAPVSFIQRLPHSLRATTIHAVEAQDHYLKVHTSGGSEMILMRLGDAVKELEGIEGARVHRSWWVNKDSVEGAERGNGRATLAVSGGLEVPVSRTYAKALREDGWF